jgi:hypothetical protein
LQDGLSPCEPINPGTEDDGFRKSSTHPCISPIGYSGSVP